MSRSSFHQRSNSRTSTHAVLTEQSGLPLAAGLAYMRLTISFLLGIATLASSGTVRYITPIHFGLCLGLSADVM
jgi:hypothetical protein